MALMKQTTDIFLLLFPSYTVGDSIKTEQLLSFHFDITCMVLYVLKIVVRSDSMVQYHLPVWYSNGSLTIGEYLYVLPFRQYTY